MVDFHSDIRIAKSGELTVTERLTVDETDGAGLLRELPAAARVIDVIRDGHPEPYALEPGPNGTRLRVGRAPPPQGRHLYQIAYRSTRHIRFLGAHDELRWQIGGLPLERVTAEVTLPANVPARDIKVETDQESFVRDGRAAFRSHRGMSIVVRFPKGVVTAPSLGQRARWFAADYGGLLAVLAGLGLTAAVLLRLKSLSRLKSGSEPEFPER